MLDRKYVVFDRRALNLMGKDICPVSGAVSAISRSHRDTKWELADMTDQGPIS